MTKHFDGVDFTFEAVRQEILEHRRRKYPPIALDFTCCAYIDACRRT